MALSTPFFSAFGPLLFGRRPLAEVDKLLGQSSSFRSLSQDQEAFGAFIPQALLAQKKRGANSRQRMFPSVLIFWAFLAQVLERGSACQKALRRIIAWHRLEDPHGEALHQDGRLLPGARPPLHADHRGDRHPPRRAAAQTRPRRRPLAGPAGQARRRDDRLHARHRGEPGGVAAAAQPAAGLGFPLVKLVGLFDLASGALLHLAEGNLRVHERVLARRLWSCLEAGDLLLADRGFCSDQELSEIAQRGADAVMRFHQVRKLDLARAEILGPNDWRVTWPKPAQCPPGGTPEAWAALPATLTVRIVRYRIETPGFRTEEVTLVTTLLDAVAYPAEALAELYCRRWSVELHLREIKTLLGLDVLRCLSPAMVRKEIALQRVAYNLGRQHRGQEGMALR